MVRCHTQRVLPFGHRLRQVVEEYFFRRDEVGVQDAVAIFGVLHGTLAEGWGELSERACGVTQRVPIRLDN